MLHSTNAHTRFVKIVARAANDTISAGASSKAGRAGAMGGGGGEAAAEAAMEMESFNDLAARYILFSLLVAFLAFVLFASPPLADWLTSERFNSGWRLKGSKKATSEDWGMGSKPTMSVPRPRPVSQRSAVMASCSYAYSKLLLPNFPFLSLTRGQVLVCVGYQALVVGFLFYGRNGVGPSNYNRPALLAYSGSDPRRFPPGNKEQLLVILIGKSYEKVNFLHRVAGRLIVICSLMHVGLVLKSYPLNFSRPTHLTGFVALLGLALVFITSISFIRNTFYRLFLVSHVVGWITFVVAVNFHSQSARSYTIFAVALYGSDLFLRAVKTRVSSATIVPLACGMTMIQAHGIEEGWRAGQHVWVRAFAGQGSLGEAHPFTIANAPASCSPLPGQHKLTLLAKSTGDWTRKLNSVAESHMTISEKGGFGVGRTIKLSVEGPYGGPMLCDFAESQTVLLIAGGSGITFAASVLEDIVGKACSGSIHARDITLVWSVKDVSCIDWYQDFLNNLIAQAKGRTSLSILVKLHVTGSSRFTSCPINGGKLSPLRPNLDSILSTAVEETLDLVAARGLARGGGVAVGTCGPAPLISAVRSSIAGLSKDRVVQVGGVTCHSETFGW